MSSPQPIVTTYHAATFAERGVVAPFTSESLIGTRLRCTSRGQAVSSRSALEAVIPNPSGGRGVYIVPWSDIRELFRPTLHDIRLGEAVVASLQSHGELTPGQVRRIARKIAKDGLAGRDAASAACAAAARDEMRVAAAGAQILQQLGRSLNLTAAATDRGGNAVLAEASVRLGRPPATLAMAVQRLGQLFADQGIGPEAQDAPVQTVIEAMREIVRDGAAWAQGAADSSASPPAVFKVAETVLRLAEHLTASLRARSGAAADLVRLMADEPDAQVALFERPEWLLDGWGHVCLLWQTANALQARAAALSEMASLVPVLPDEADGWFGLPPGTAAKIGAQRRAEAPRARGGSALDAVARNEQLRSLAA